MRFKITITLVLACLWGPIFAQDSIRTDSTERDRYFLEIRTGVSGTKSVPFWMRTNQFGSTPPAGAYGSMILGYYHDYQSPNIRNKLDLSVRLEGRLNVGRNNEFQAIEANMGLRFNIFEFKLGRSRDIMGITDSVLSSGAFTMSGNARGIPKVEISIPKYWSVPFTNGWLSLKGNFNYGYMGRSEVYLAANRNGYAGTLSHQKSLYFKIGSPEKKWALSGGFNHQVQFGAEQKFTPNWGLSKGQTLLYVAIGKVHKGSKIGNHIGSIDQAIDYDFSKVHIQAYHQFFYEVGGLVHLNNLKDGLWGLSIQNKIASGKAGWRKLLVEVLTTKSQGGELDAKITPSGDEDYYNNYLYANGWTYQGENIGSNLLTSKKYLRTDLPQRDREYIVNNRVYALHLGIDGYIGDWNGIAKLTGTKNFGTYGTSPEGNSTGRVRTIYAPPYFPASYQFSGYLELNRYIKKYGVNVGGALALDKGQVLYDGFGAFLKVSKRL
ncbi:hypothetical protein C7T94_01120 [Pedobacter yulinensis]|uniref:Capsule assembly Wzi family protein n=1 Tax=Pedobacter yulinensis TaxID=2126353 RepID=A0A2T3HQN7_9SPHI|nr:capsule assembly Wzi family protein [Pedobacter yulinensis]PST84758.1 hypothetical protein C7T94_01120 [Pedobacter yulinensis]